MQTYEQTARMQTRDFPDFKAAITVTDCYCGLKGLEIGYTLDGEEKFLELGPKESAQLLKVAGVIEDYNPAEELFVDVMTDHGGYDRTTTLSWGEFIFGWDGLYTTDAKNIVAHYENMKQYEPWAAKMRSIPGMIKRMGGAQ